MLREILKKKQDRIMPVLSHSYMMLSPVDKVVDGVLVRTSEFVNHSVADDYKGFSANDFSISNILATGSTNLLNPVTMANHDVVGLADSFDALAAKLDANETE